MNGLLQHSQGHVGHCVTYRFKTYKYSCIRLPRFVHGAVYLYCKGISITAKVVSLAKCSRKGAMKLMWWHSMEAGFNIASHGDSSVPRCLAVTNGIDRAQILHEILLTGFVSVQHVQALLAGYSQCIWVHSCLHTMKGK